MYIPINVFTVINRFGNRFLIHSIGQGKLNQDTMDRVVIIKFLDNGKELIPANSTVVNIPSFNYVEISEPYFRLGDAGIQFAISELHSELLEAIINKSRISALVQTNLFCRRLLHSYIYFRVFPLPNLHNC